MAPFEDESGEAWVLLLLHTPGRERLSNCEDAGPRTEEVRREWSQLVQN